MHGAIFIFDVRDREGFVAIRDFFIDDVKKNTGKNPKNLHAILIGINDEVPDVRVEVGEVEANELADKYGILYKNVALNDKTVEFLVPDIFVSVARDILKSALERENRAKKDEHEYQKEQEEKERKKKEQEKKKRDEEVRKKLEQDQREVERRNEEEKRRQLESQKILEQQKRQQEIRNILIIEKIRKENERLENEIKKEEARRRQERNEKLTSISPIGNAETKERRKKIISTSESESEEESELHRRGSRKYLPGGGGGNFGGFGEEGGFGPFGGSGGYRGEEEEPIIQIVPKTPKIIAPTTAVISTSTGVSTATKIASRKYTTTTSHVPFFLLDNLRRQEERDFASRERQLALTIKKNSIPDKTPFELKKEKKKPIKSNLPDDPTERRLIFSAKYLRQEPDVEIYEEDRIPEPQYRSRRTIRDINVFT